MSNKKNRNKSKKELNTNKELVACPSCNAMVYPISLEVDEKGEPKEIICSSCKEDVLPMIKAYKEFVEVRNKQRKEEEEQKLAHDPQTTPIMSESNVVSADYSIVESEDNS